MGTNKVISRAGPGMEGMARCEMAKTSKNSLLRKEIEYEFVMPRIADEASDEQKCSRVGQEEITQLN
jgi:hypothetical protein